MNLLKLIILFVIFNRINTASCSHNGSNPKLFFANRYTYNHIHKSNKGREMVRYFISIDMPQNVKDEIAKIQNLFKNEKSLSANFVDPEKLHLTLKFLGPLDSQTINKIKEKLSEIKFNSFKAILGNLSFFSQKDSIRVIWIDILSNDIKKLQKEIENQLNNNHIPNHEVSKKEFVSHVTIARVKQSRNTEQIKKIINNTKVPKIEFTIDCFALKKSESKNDGTAYTDVNKYSLEIIKVT